MTWLAKSKEEAFAKLRAMGREVISMAVLSEVSI